MAPTGPASVWLRSILGAYEEQSFGRPGTAASGKAHGWKARIFEEFVRTPPIGVDVLLMEGTNLRQQGDPKSGKTEQDIEIDLIHTFKATAGIVLAMYSAQNIDRLVTMFRACIQAGRHLVVDLYAASIAAAIANPNIPKAGFEKLLVYVPLRQRIQVKESREFERVASVTRVRIFPEELAARAPELVLSFRSRHRWCGCGRPKANGPPSPISSGRPLP